MIVGWLLYVLGRFLVGAWVARKGWLQRAGGLLPQHPQDLHDLPSARPAAWRVIYVAMDFEHAAGKIFFVKGSRSTPSACPILDHRLCDRR